MTRPGVRFSAVLWGLAGLVLLAVLWEGYKAVGPVTGVQFFGQSILPKTDDRSMPHLVDMVTRALQPVNSAVGSPPVWVSVIGAALNSLGVAAVGWVAGSVVGFLLALLMQRLRVAERAVLPWLILSQTVPLIALAPVIVAWGGKIQIGAFSWDRWMSVAVIASYLAFFPVAVGALRGLQSPDAIHLELMRTYNAGWFKTLLRLRLPASVPYLIPALRLGAASAIVGTVVAEVSTGYKGGIGRMIIEFAQSGTSDPAKAYAPIAGAVILGLVSAGLVALVGLALKRFNRQEAAS
ncbi:MULTISPECIES: ABC transporter permease [Subtercola]|uniref:ABC transporter permease subunit n=1 Tax=Subtercola vilae TaxID=2056433 RepID=A0A4T2BQ36_9MICO|nr:MULTISPECIES: ABC transporter permease subunit [Subtercola]MEA9986644.1 ABC transporter permease subunit [Subtercola sp. RTI3]TIH31506.1 ABC transporter permease subunit [Subtercola vilae]